MFRHIVRDAAATDRVDSGIGFFLGHAVEDCAYGCFRKALWATFGGHGKKIEGGTDKRDITLTGPCICQWIGVHLEV